jgi:hypothetical protein
VCRHCAALCHQMVAETIPAASTGHA